MPFRILVFLLLCLGIKATAQTANITEPYASQWKKADSLLARGLPQSAKKIVDKIYTDAQAKGQQVSMLKAQLYLIQIDGQNNEQADTLSIARAESQIRSTPFPVNAVWQSIEAQLYWNYYQRNRYKILSRTHTTEPTGNDFEQWDAAMFAEKASSLYLQSISRPESLKAINIETYDPVLIKGTNTRNLRPSLFDLLAFRAIDFFSNDEKDLTRPSFQFVMDDAAAFAPAPDFIKHRFETRDTVSLQYHALKLYQEVLRMHLGDANPDALLDADLHRLEFVYSHSVHPDKGAFYRAALERLEKKYNTNAGSAVAAYRIAALMMESEITSDGDDNSNPNPASKIDLIPIKARLERIVTQYPKSEGGIAAAQLLQSILTKSINITAEEAILPDVPSRILLKYKNLDHAYIRVVKLNAADLREKARSDNEGYMQSLVALSPIQSFNTTLPGTSDYAEHSTELKIDPLPFGTYAVIISAEPSFSKMNNGMSVAVFQCTRLAVVTKGNSTSGASGYVLSRDNGMSVAGAAVSFTSQEWNNSTRRYDYKQSAAIATATDGSFKVSGTEHNYNGMLIKKGADEFFSSGYFNFYQYRQEKTVQERTFFFTDRSIYRPGQTIYFKGIAISTDASERSNVVTAGKDILVTFYDANGQKVASQTLKTNEWGSITGTFIAPSGGLTGTMRIEGGNGDVYISVEEYKRPKFKVEWDTLKKDYALNESVSLTGHAIAYAGNNVDGGAVKYRVVRQARWPYYWYAGRWGGNRSAEQEIAQGAASTDADGKFTIRFQTLPDRSIDERSLPVFTYKIYADVTDINGETRSGTESITAGYRSLQFDVVIPEQGSRNDLDTLHISTQNLNGDFVAASVHIKVARLQQPEVLYLKRLWGVPDQFVMTEADFRKAFPLDAYKNEDDYRTWKEAATVADRTINTTAAGTVVMDQSVFVTNGWYVVSLSAKDKNGKDIEEKRYVQVWDRRNTGKPYAALLTVPQQQSAEPGSNVTVAAVTGLNEVHVIRQVQTMDEQTLTSQHDTRNGVLDWSKMITESDRGGIALSYLMVKDNRVYTQSATINIPWTNKDLDISWETHRDKLLPGAKETWTMVVRGNKKEKVAAEMMAALYDASLDAFKPHEWSIPSLFPMLQGNTGWESSTGFNSVGGRQLGYFKSGESQSYSKSYDQIQFFSTYYELTSQRYRDGLSIGGARSTATKYVADGVALSAPMARQLKASTRGDKSTFTNTPPASVESVTDAPEDIAHNQQPPDKAPPIRKNLQETAFFYPQLHTDAEGTVRIEFTIPEALTEWKLLAFAHTKDMRMGYTTGAVKTQKDLMVQPGLPRFLRQGDDITLSTKIANLSDKVLTGTASIEILDALTMRPAGLAFRLVQKDVAFTVGKGGSTAASWSLHVPESRYEPVIIRITAKAGAFTDGEENVLPVLTNRMLVTETLPLWMNGTGTKTFRFDKLLASGDSKTLAQHALTVEYTSNPAWYAVQALPYLMEYPYECAEQTFNRYYANALAAYILEKAPRVKDIFRKWETIDTAALQSNLEKNQELKSALLEETPWVLDAQNENKQKHNIALLFQTSKLAAGLNTTAQKLEDMLMPEGGFPWFKGDTRPDQYITQYIVTGIGRLQHLGVKNERLASIASRAIPYLDRKMMESYKELLRRKVKMSDQHIGYLETEYLYMRSFFANNTANEISAEAMAFYRKQAQQYWPSFNPYMKGMIALSQHRTGGDKQVTQTIIQSLRETAQEKEEMGMYWMDRGRSWWWWEAPIEAQSLLIECFTEVAKDDAAVDKMRRWLLKQKQTQNWPTTKATADACYALLLRGTQWLSNEPEVRIDLGGKTISSSTVKTEAGTGYFKTRYAGQDVSAQMGNITLNVTNPGGNQPSWGAVYWQYFENLDKITSAATPLVVKKQLFVERNTDRGPFMEAISGAASLRIGDKVKARIEIIVDRDMEYVHLKDGRASCFEPVNVLSGYRWQGGLGYYESTRDASSNFFFSYLPKGKYVFEYPMFTTSVGDFSNGIATIQCMYAPEFSAHSEGVRVKVVGK